MEATMVLEKLNRLCEGHVCSVEELISFLFAMLFVMFIVLLMK